MSENYKVELLDIQKAFGGVQALKNGRLQVKPGEIHGLVGENGAGKSTLIKVLSGAHRHDAGQVLLDGKDANIHSPKDSIDKGVAVIYQEFMLAPHLTVAENIFIDHLTQKKGIINWRSLAKSAQDLLDALGFGNISPMTLVSDIPVAHQQVVEICKALSRNAKVLVLDEPTAVLTFAEIEKLFVLLNQLKQDGVSIIYISHRLEEIFTLCDRITIMKDGDYMDTVLAQEIDKEGLINKMIGRSMTEMFPTRKAQIGDVVFEAKNIYAGKMVNDVSFNLRSGEVLGFAGLVGAGRTETMRAIFGVDIMEKGEITYFGQSLRFRSPKQAVKNGFGLLPEDRKRQGVLLDQSIRVNATLAAIDKGKNKLGIFDAKKEKAYVQDILAQLNTKYNSTEDNASSLSGGNQQKVALSKWLAADCKVIVLDEPTRGVDVGAKVEIYKNINDLAAKGVAIIMISSEMPELIGMCDRVMVMRFGSVVGELKKDEITESNLIALEMGVA